MNDVNGMAPFHGYASVGRTSKKVRRMAKSTRGVRMLFLWPKALKRIWHSCWPSWQVMNCRRRYLLYVGKAADKINESYDVEMRQCLVRSEC